MNLTTQQMLDVVNAYFGPFPTYTLRQTSFGNWALDLHDDMGFVIVKAERLGTQQEIYNYVAGMHTIVHKLLMEAARNVGE